MEEQFEDQGGSSTSSPPAIMRWVMSKVIPRVAGIEAQRRRRAKAERARTRAGERHRIEYFHQVDDPYSHLAAQLLRPLCEHYDVELICHLAPVVHDSHLPEPELLAKLGHHEARRLAPYYGLSFPHDAKVPTNEKTDLANRILARVEAKDFPEVAVSLGEALFDGDDARLDALAMSHEPAPAEAAQAAIEQGRKRRDELGHYSSGMFHCAPEWYWGADRFYHLENRLIEHAARRDTSKRLLCPRPQIAAGPLKDTGTLTLEFYPSLRSPYTSVIFDITVQFARDVGINLVVRPVLPMVMRGVPAPRRKGLYIMADTAREADALGLDWGGMYDPIGDPVRNAYSLYPWACEQEKGTELLSSFLRAAFFDAVNTNNDRGMKKVVEDAGLSWQEARTRMGNRDWEDELEANRLAMYAFDSWGVPSYRLLDAQGNQVLGVWGQDRLWLVAREIQRLLDEAS
ncbi:MAG: 2-hydroxychromene-2-carboxylate isomerase [bacterium]|nr:2-hydroxychromene-2-carboxylate isomerase [bacterium]